ncbi:hypothetical protein HMPREF1550_00300 [Actinomyces sp. oral taxon 877 str. F0543]|nr:hypothetical protein HMPREF1550_00300 [Actinomyces sp. oral taxon 877 str. F0543]
MSSSAPGSVKSDAKDAAVVARASRTMPTPREPSLSQTKTRLSRGDHGTRSGPGPLDQPDRGRI